MVVEVDLPGIRNPVIMKLYDRCYSPQLRKDVDIQSWSAHIEEIYLQSVRDGSAHRFTRSIRDDPDIWEKEGDEWNAFQKEVYLYTQMQRLYHTETTIYDQLVDLQGKDIPQLLERFTLLGNHSSTKQFFECPGILLQYLEGFSLEDLGVKAGLEHWQKIGEETIRIVNDIGGRNIRNDDVQLRNFVVVPAMDEFKVFMIDFASCVLRKAADDEYSWRRSKRSVDEEGCVGLALEDLLGNAFKYHPSEERSQLRVEF